MPLNLWMFNSFIFVEVNKSQKYETTEQSTIVDINQQFYSKEEKTRLKIIFIVRCLFSLRLKNNILSLLSRVLYVKN